MQTRPLYFVPDPGLIYTRGLWLSQDVSGFTPLNGENKPGPAPADVSEFKTTERVVVTLVISVGRQKGQCSLCRRDGHRVSPQSSATGW